MKNAKGFDIAHGIDRDMEYIEIIFYRKYPIQDTYNRIGKVKFDRNIGYDEDYSHGRIEFTENNFDDLKNLYKILDDIDSNIDYWECNFREVMDYLINNYHRVIYDYRVRGGYIREIDRPAENLKLYMLDLNGNYMFSILAENKEDAENKFKQRVLDNLETGIDLFGKREQFENWLDNPVVTLDDSSYYNEIETIEEILNK